KSAQIREILISESAWEEMTCLFAPSLVEFVYIVDARSTISAKAEALNQARNERLSHIQITRIREVAA
ncbi:hypothetical protein LVW13_17645, partial [Klebsiella variicola subsp. variicola]|nr:hypothetical protein [Klebsiella variicola subsp. variicola]